MISDEGLADSLAAFREAVDEAVAARRTEAVAVT
jgi:hypothetical protein